MQHKPFDSTRYIKDNQTLQHCCKQWSQAALLAIDTEFIRTDTFYPIAALLQVSDGSASYLIDPLTISDFSCFVDLLVNPNIVKVLHACSEDLEVFDRLFGVLPRPLIDTQIAASMAGLGFSIGYQRLTEALLQIHVEKGETRSNWLQRPLTDSQIHYAALDVEYLPAMYQLLHDSLSQKGSWSWLQQECDSMVNNYDNQAGTDQYYKKIKSAWKLTAEELALLQLITQWREHKAREKNKPRGRILKDRSCFEIAKFSPTTTSALFNIEDMSAGTIRKYSDEIFSIIDSFKNINALDYPALLPPPLSSNSRGLVKKLKLHVAQCAENLSIAPEILVKKRDYEALIRSGSEGSGYQLPESLMGWRKAVVGDTLLAMVEQASN